MLFMCVNVAHLAYVQWSLFAVEPCCNLIIFKPNVNRLNYAVCSVILRIGAKNVEKIKKCNVLSFVILPICHQ